MLSEFLFTFVFVIIGCYQFFEEFLPLEVYKAMGLTVLFTVAVIYVLEGIVVKKLVAMKDAEEKIRIERESIEKGLEKPDIFNV